MSVIHNATRDLTGRQPARGPGMAIAIRFMCKHDGSRTGAVFRHGVPMRCARCELARVLERARAA
jgi:hypothetical protein